MMNVEASVFRSNRSQAVRLPKAEEFPEGVKRVVITRIGNARLIAPVGMEWDSFFAGPAAGDDFMSEREQPDMQRREAL